MQENFKFQVRFRQFLVQKRFQAHTDSEIVSICFLPTETSSIAIARWNRVSSISLNLNFEKYRIEFDSAMRLNFSSSSFSISLTI